MRAGTNTGEGKSGEKYYFRWWGLYKVQKDMYANDEIVGSLMISSKQWDEIMKFTGYGAATRELDTYNGLAASGAPYKNTTDTYDLAKNIYDLAGNLWEWTLEPGEVNQRINRGGYYAICRRTDSVRYLWADNYNGAGSRVALYIK